MWWECVRVANAGVRSPQGECVLGGIGLSDVAGETWFGDNQCKHNFPNQGLCKRRESGHAAQGVSQGVFFADVHLWKGVFHSY